MGSKVFVKDLDDLFGACREPERCTHAETHKRPESLTKLDDESAAHIRAIMLAAETVPLVRGLFGQVPLLWIVDEAGDIYISLEEIVTLDSLRLLRPRSRRDDAREGETKLGHPALVGESNRARIGGELCYDPGWGVQIEGWYLSNASGRYGVKAGLNDQHLRNVVAKFAEFGIEVRPVFY